MRHYFLLLLFFFCPTLRAADNLAIPPHELPLFDGEARDFRAKPPPLPKSPTIDTTQIYGALINCYPSRSSWTVDIDLRSGYRQTIDESGDEWAGGWYAGVVARIPLYSTTELDREREREARRRVDTAARLAEWVKAVNDRNAALRERGLYTALEARAQHRVRAGISSADEQVAYLQKVIDAEAKLRAAEAMIDGNRLALVGLCRDEAQDAIDEHLRKLASLPK